MLVTDLTRRALANRRERRDYERAGWEKCRMPREMLERIWAGGRITDVELSADGQSVWVKIRRGPVAQTISNKSVADLLRKNNRQI